MKFIEPYGLSWKAEFEKLYHVFRNELSDLNPPIDIQHVGSTSIPGMIAKPILDIDIIISDPAQLQLIHQKLEKIGYQPKGEQGIPGRFAFRQTSSQTPQTATKDTWQNHHLYVCLADSVALKNHLGFRNALLKDARLADQYAQLKQTLCSNPDITMEQYWKSKTAFIVSVLANAGFSENELADIENANK
ncbi:GrpB family protein [Terrimonas sp. NA20]|uniref:GrpB family protein n=1 Tax=Terrimonas ginsenosidimutans TaxID=2908004 RepID=A0ABS9KMS7_9BACT|nr:GrpB family protein [Terrimonas ginsenosidimutans]MCG2613613.1 GrpB family protein [Terrimonas ginsenosidimutans]